MTDSNSLILYDISSPIQPRSYAPNPSKARLTLSFKRVPFKTTWVDIPDIANDPASGRVVGDSFDIANYLEDTFPDSGGCLFPPDSTRTGLDYESPHKDTPFYAPLTTNQGSKNEAYAKFNVNVDATFSAHVMLVAHYMPFNPNTAEAAKALFVKRAHMNSWDDFSVQGEAREQLKAQFKEALTSLAQPFTVHETGPYLEGEQANYADLIVGGWLNMFSVTMPAEEWKDFRTWHGGVFARLHDALQENYFHCV
ncbi:glutathione s-transferase protein [Rutstroemia sp. NJR-2017a BBW]|nr:glutathione s-transferase protein [Rutstroemia sp. NJR-2017a BBW]